MPATERAFAEAPPAHLYLDTNILVAHFVSNHVHHEQARDFLLPLFASGLTTLYVSPLTWVELTHVVCQAEFRQALPEQWQREARLARWDRADVRRAYLRSFWVALEQLLNQFGWTEIALTEGMRARALTHVSDYGLAPEDALHLAAAQETGVFDLASFDAAFRRVDGLSLWNDHLYGAS
ncbi:MAG TPA: type II toxin-antitoxin system VapC family toxin [Chloroflexota bacterium]|nr:type II toxin-antitoxin system VapC family toxin [Chloroflexota bacterium]